MKNVSYPYHFVGVATFLTAMVLGTLLLSQLVINHSPANFEWQANRAVAAGDLLKAEQVLKNQMISEHYNFKLHRLLAEVLLKQDRPAEAAELMQLSIERERAVSGRKVFNRGYDSHRSHLILSNALTAVGENVAAGSAAARAQEKMMLQGVGIIAEQN